MKRMEPSPGVAASLARGPWFGVMLAAGSTVLAALLRWALDPLFGGTAQFLVFYFSVMLSAVAGGTRAGLLATALGALAGHWLFVGLDHTGPTLTDDVTRLAFFLLFSGVAAVVAGQLRNARNLAVARAEALAEAAEKLQSVAHKYRIVADHTDAWEFWLSPAGRFLYNSPSCKRVTGYDAEAFQDDPELFTRIIHPGDRNLYEEHRGHGHETCVTEEAEFRIVRADGTVRWIGHTCVPLYDEDRWFLGIRGSNRDITERKAAEETLRLSEEQLRESELRYRTLFDSIDEGFCIIEVLFDDDARPHDYRFLVTNPAFEKQTGLIAAQGKSMRALAPKHEEHWFETYGTIALTGQPARFQARAEQLQRWFDVYAFRFGQPDQRQVAILFSDITARKQAEEELVAAKASAERAKAEAERANRAKDHFLAILSHELRTPLTPVVMGVSMLQGRSDLDQEARETLEMIRRNVEMEARLIDDLLDVTGIARGKIELHRSPVELCAIIHRAVEVCKPDIEARRLHFGVDLGAAAPYWVEADVPRLQQVFWNLLKNAIKFTPHSGCVGIRCRPNREHVLVEVNDSGIGIEAEALPRVFNAFEQAERSITRQFGGLGLGLAISKALVEMHGGTIEVSSAGRDKGATFRILLPLTAPAGQPAAPLPAAPRRAVRPLHILLVEDHGVTAKMMRLVLTTEGHTVETAGDVATALELADRRTFDLLLSDLGLPDGSGHDLMRELRARGRRFPGIALSGYGQEDDIHRSYQAGFVAHLTKPASPEAVFEAVAAAMAGERSASSGAVVAAAEPDVPVFDDQAALRRCLGKPDLLCQMIAFFFDDVHALLPQIRSALERGELTEVERIAHRLRGTIVRLAAEPAAAAALRVERLGRGDNGHPDAEHAVSMLEEQCHRLRRALADSHAAAAPTRHDTPPDS